MLGGPAMKRALILVPRGDLDTVIEAVASLGVLHLLDLSGREEWSWAVRPHDVGEAVRARRDTLRSLEALVRFFAPPPTRTPADAALPPVAAVESRVAGWMVEMERLRGERQRLASTIEHLEHYRESAAALAPAGISPARLRAMQRLAPACGWMALGDVPRLEEVLARIPHRLVVAGSRGAQRLVLAFVLPRDREALERALKSTGWVAADLPEQDELLDEGAVERHLAEARAALKALEDEAARSRTALAEPLALARAAIERDLLLLEAQSFTSRSESVVFVSGWIPADRVHALRSAVERVTRGRCHVEIEDPQSIDTVRSGAEPVPILFRNPALVRPFERLTAAYGAPRWREIDPTPIVAVAFWIMFGVMFGDVGHGLVLGAAGWWIFRRLPRYRDYGVILMECGLASAAFGVAFGSVFGFENLLPALWFHPIEDVPRLLRVGTAFGLVFLSLSFALGLVNALRRRDWSGAVFGAHGLLAALAYWIAAALGLRWLATGRAGVDAGLVAVLLGAPLALLWIARVAAALRARRSEGGGAGAGAVGALLEGAVELVDVVVRGVANTVSFVRLAAFAVSHAGLLLAVFALEQTVSQSRFGTLWGVLVVVTGNVIILALEGLIVSIQSVRLVYYEFFSRFHEGSGLEYRPLRLRTAIGEEMS